MIGFSKKKEILRYCILNFYIFQPNYFSLILNIIRLVNNQIEEIKKYVQGNLLNSNIKKFTIVKYYKLFNISFPLVDLTEL